MAIDWEFNYEFNEVWHSLFRPQFAKWLQKNLVCLGPKIGRRISDKNTIIFCSFSVVTWSKRGAQLKDRLFWAANNLGFRSPSHSGKFIFWLNFTFFIRGNIVYFCENRSKIKVSGFKCQSIGNFITSSTRYDIPYSDLNSQNDCQKT